MSSLTGSLNSVAASSTAGYGLFNQLQRALPGDQSRVTLLRNNIAEVQFDCCLSESHSYQATPTQFPIEDGSAVSDHIQTAPISLQLSVVIADHPPETDKALVAAGVSAAGSAALAPLGAVGTLASTVGFASLSAATSDEGKSMSRSAAFYATLKRLAGFGQAGDSGTAQSVGPPDVVDVVTAKLGKAFCRFGSMAITNIDMQRDNSVGSRSLVFNISMVQVRRVLRSTAIVSFAMPVKQAPKQSVQSKPEEDVVSAHRKEFETGSPNISPVYDFAKSLAPGVDSDIVRGLAP